MFATQENEERQLTGPELSLLAERMVFATNPDASFALREEIVRGFYGGQAEGCHPVGVRGPNPSS